MGNSQLIFVCRHVVDPILLIVLVFLVICGCLVIPLLQICLPNYNFMCMETHCFVDRFFFFKCTKEECYKLFDFTPTCMLNNCSDSILMIMEGLIYTIKKPRLVWTSQSQNFRQLLGLSYQQVIYKIALEFCISISSNPLTFIAGLLCPFLILKLLLCVLPMKLDL